MIRSGGSTPAKDPPPNGAPADWKAKVTATFKVLDKEGAGYISTVPSKLAQTSLSEISVLGADVLEKQVAAGDLKASIMVTLPDWIAVIKGKCEEKGWGAVGAFLEAVDAAAATDKKSEVEAAARGCFAALDADWAEPPKSGAVDIASEVETLGDGIPTKCKSLLAGLEKGTKVSADEWIAHVSPKVDTLGGPRVLKMVGTITLRVEKAKEMEDAF